MALVCHHKIKFKKVNQLNLNKMGQNMALSIQNLLFFWGKGNK